MKGLLRKIKKRIWWIEHKRNITDEDLHELFHLYDDVIHISEYINGGE